MKFSDLQLLVAVGSLQRKGDPISDHARFKHAEAVRAKFTRLFRTTCFPWSVSEVMELCIVYRKNITVRVKADIAAKHGFECFWKHRHKGPCCDEVEGGHVVSRADGAGELTVQNGMIECRSHNNQRRERTIEEYLISDDVTG